MWQFAPTKKFEPDDFAAFLSFLPSKIGGVALRHALEVRHASFACPEFVALARKRGCAIVVADHATYPLIADPTADFMYARLQTGDDGTPTAYTAKQLDTWAAIARGWAAGDSDVGLPLLAPATKALKRDCFLYIIHEGKLRAPAGAIALGERLGLTPDQPSETPSAPRGTRRALKR